jgi:hypothetical protein
MDTSFLGVSGPRTAGFPGVSEGFRGFPSFQRSCGRCKNSIKTYENGKSAPGFPVAEQTPIILLESRWRQEWHGVLVWSQVFLEFYVRLVSEISASTFSRTLRLSDFAPPSGALEKGHCQEKLLRTSAKQFLLSVPHWGRP